MLEVLNVEQGERKNIRVIEKYSGKIRRANLSENRNKVCKVGLVSYVAGKVKSKGVDDLQTFSSPISIFAPSTVPTNNPPFKQNFMFEVPLASAPAVEMCCEMLLVGTNNSARDTE